jgi:chemotaxis signal transduction protein
VSIGAAHANQAADLREAFDRSFAQASVSEADDDVEKLLGIRIGDDRYVVRLSGLSGVFADRRVTPLPSPVSELRGIAGFRGAVLPIYDLGMLLGYPRAMAPRWIVVTAAPRIGLAFAGFDGYVSVRGAVIVPETRTETRDWHVREVLRGERSQPIIFLPSIIEAIARRTGQERQI